MRFIKLGIISIVLLGLLITAISLLLPSRIVVRRAVEIQAEPDSIFKKVSDLNEWKHWLINRDSLNLIVANNSPHQLLTMGNTSISITGVDSNLITTSWRVNKGEPMNGFFSLISHNNTATTTLQWDFEQNIGWYPWEKFGATASDKVLGPFMEQSLNNLKQNLEAAN